MTRVRLLLVAVLLLNMMVLAEHATGADKLDVVFGIDLTGSMGGEISQVKTHSNSIMNQIAALVPDCAFGVVSIVDYPHYYSSYGYSATYGSASTGDYAYKTDLNITTNRTTVASTLNGLYLRWGADWPQDYVRMLYESQFLNWRDGATRILIVFGDAPAHDDDLFSRSYGGDPGRDEIMGTADDLDYQEVIQQVKAAGIKVVSVDSTGTGDEFINFEYMASQTGGRHFLLADASQIPEAIIELIKGSIAEEFIWQQINLDGDVYTVKVKANKKPDDPSTFVYPVYCGTCDVGYEPQSMKVQDPDNNIITDAEIKRNVLAYARNAALYRSWKSESFDPIPILDKVPPLKFEGTEIGNFFLASVTWPAKYCCIPLIGWCAFEEGGDTYTDFGYNYPGYLRFPVEYDLIANGIPRLVDWEYDWNSLLALLCGGPVDYIHPVGIKHDDHRKKIYQEMIHTMIMQDGVRELEDVSKKQLAAILKQTANALDEADPAEAELASKLKDIADILIKVGGENAMIEALRAISLNADQMAKISDVLQVANNYTAWAAKYAPTIGFFLQFGLDYWENAEQEQADIYLAYLHSTMVYAHGLDILLTFA